MIRFFIFVMGLCLNIIGLIFIISYGNLLSLGYNFEEYAKFICSKIECLAEPIGLIIILLSITMKGEKK